MPTRSLADALHASDAGPLLSRLALHQRIGVCIAEALGPLAAETGCTGAGHIEQRGSTVVLRVSTTATAAKLRQTVPRILLNLQRQGVQVTEIRVKVQPEVIPETTGGKDPLVETVSTQATNSAASRDASGPRALAETLSRRLPDSPLQRAAESLRKRLARGE